MSTFIERIKALFGPTPSSEKTSGDTHAPETRAQAENRPTLDDADVRTLMMALSMTRDDELSCAEVYALLDEYADHVINDEDAAALMPLVEHHLVMCQDCCGQYDALIEVLEADES